MARLSNFCSRLHSCFGKPQTSFVVLHMDATAVGHLCCYASSAVSGTTCSAWGTTEEKGTKVVSISAPCMVCTFMALWLENQCVFLLMVVHMYKNFPFMYRCQDKDKGSAEGIALSQIHWWEKVKITEIWHLNEMLMPSGAQTGLTVLQLHNRLFGYRVDTGWLKERGKGVKEEQGKGGQYNGIK